MEITFVCQPFNNEQYREGLLGLGKIGYRRIEVKDSRFHHFGTEVMQKILLESNLSVYQINTYFNVVQSEDSVEKSLKLNEEMLTLAKTFQVPFIRIFTGPLGEGKVGAAEATEAIWKRATEGLRMICRAGALQGVQYAVETHHGTLAESTPAILRLLEDVDATNFHVNLQIPLKNEPDVYESTRLLAPYVRHTHLNNYDAAGHNTFLDEGIYDIRRQISILRKAGYDGALSVEHAYHHQPVLMVAEREFAFLSSIMKELS